MKIEWGFDESFHCVGRLAVEGVELSVACSCVASGRATMVYDVVISSGNSVGAVGFERRGLSMASNAGARLELRSLPLTSIDHAKAIAEGAVDYLVGLGVIAR